MTLHRTCLHLVISAMALLTISACGVQLQAEAIPVPANVIPSPLKIPVPDTSQPPATTEQSSSRLRIWFVQDDGLAAVESLLPTGSEPDLIVQSLVVGPTPTQADDGLRTVAADPLTGIPFVSVDPSIAEANPTAAASASSSAAAPPDPESVTVRLSSAFTSLPPGEQVLLLGQVVLSLTGAGARAVTFTDEAGAVLAVPLPDGRLLDGPVTARDYAGLIVRP